jgi:hypothetical protein
LYRRRVIPFYHGDAPGDLNGGNHRFYISIKRAHWQLEPKRRTLRRNRRIASIHNEKSNLRNLKAAHTKTAINIAGAMKIHHAHWHLQPTGNGESP